MRRYSLTYFLGQSLKGLWRNGVMSIASITVLMSCLILMGSFALLVYNINYNLEGIGELNEIAVFVSKEKSEAEVTEIGKQINALEYVTSVTFVSKQEALVQEKEKYSAYPQLFTIFEEGDNPYPDSFIVLYENNSKVSTLKYQLEHIDGIYHVNCRADIAQTIENLKSGIFFVFIWFLIILFVVSIFIIVNTIKTAVYTRSKEISIMRYIGATNNFITIPFVFEGFFIGLLAGGLAYLAVRYIYYYIEKFIIIEYKMISIIPFGETSLYVLLGFAAVGILTGVIGSALSARRYLRV